MSDKLLLPYNSGSLELKNRTVMAPMTRSRATSNNIPTDIMTNYYQQRATAGLIITEGTSPSPNGLGYSSIPGIFNAEQVAGWKKVTDAVHQGGGKIVIQLMHTGRIGHPLNLPEGAEILAPSAVKAAGQMFTVKEGMQDHPEPRAFSTEEVQSTIEEYVTAAKNSIDAGFDGIELHAANGYLIEQFLNPGTNTRDDQYGGSIENRSRFLLEIVEQTVKVIGKDKVGVRFSPYGAFNDMPAYDAVDETYTYLAEKLNELEILYIHVLDHSAGNSSPDITRVKDIIRSRFQNILIFCGGFNKEKAEEELKQGIADLIAFGVPFLTNPDLVKRMEVGAELNQPDYNSFYTPGEKGYTDYPFLNT
ncbi:alkene reductase [Daejeonella lutea]|uniref:N-ethylmaleimide reductase n=1 Tax=Daejeonella lutea TaxID=572036 RepID=A0A1T5F4R7_9SPHI|nr:alkene reductase [Daejeonella lutea]SKB91214.1 N-ethylmaleimide reductase [Daejeonella lutea]